MVGHAYSRRRMCSYSAARAGERGTRERAKKQTQEPSRKEIICRQPGAARWLPRCRQTTRTMRARLSPRSSANGCNGWLPNGPALPPPDLGYSLRPPQLTAAIIAAVS